MDTISSAEFRKTYPRLTEATEVTVNGHVIGTWRPINAPIYQLEAMRLEPDEEVVDFGLGTPEQQELAAHRIDTGVPGTTLIEPSFNSRPFTPVPKRKGG